MSIPSIPPLNGRNLAEFYVAGEAAKRTILAAYARPPEQQQARIIMYDPVRRIIPEYFQSGQDDNLLAKAEQLLRQKSFTNAEFAEKWTKSNRSAIANLRAFHLPGKFQDVHPVKKSSITVGNLRVLSTADFYARYTPKAANAREKRIAFVVNPSGVKRPDTKRKTWIAIESEIALRVALANGHEIDEVWYLDLPKNELTHRSGPRNTIWAEIDATCERIFRDWRDIRLAATSEGIGFA